MIRVPVNPGLLRWARERSGIAHEYLEDTIAACDQSLSVAGLGWQRPEVP